MHWKEAKADVSLPSGRKIDTIWNRLGRELGQVKIEKDKLDHLFESRAVELKPKVRKSPDSECMACLWGWRRGGDFGFGMLNILHCTCLDKPTTVSCANHVILDINTLFIFIFVSTI